MRRSLLREGPQRDLETRQEGASGAVGVDLPGARPASSRTRIPVRGGLVVIFRSEADQNNGGVF